MNNNNITRRDFFKTASKVTATSMACASLVCTEVAFAAGKPETKKRPWIDTHIHVSDVGGDGRKRERMLEDLLDVLDRCDADLRFIICPDGFRSKDPSAILEANQMVYDLCRRAAGRLYGSCMVNPNFLRSLRR